MASSKLIKVYRFSAYFSHFSDLSNKKMFFVRSRLTDGEWRVTFLRRLKVTNVTLQDAGLYTCEGFNVFGRQLTTGQLTVRRGLRLIHYSCRVFNLPPEGMWSIAITVFVCLFVCLSAHISEKPHVLTSRNFLYMLPVAVVRSPPTTIQYVMYFWFCGWRHIFTYIYTSLWWGGYVGTLAVRLFPSWMIKKQPVVGNSFSRSATHRLGRACNSPGQA